jgi:hypothetical protein
MSIYDGTTWRLFCELSVTQFAMFLVGGSLTRVQAIQHYYSYFSRFILKINGTILLAILETGLYSFVILL